ncbi:MAG: riboflavin synthase [Ignavibacteria bacterium]|jgi:riboflavin synthase|nr:riboflavin synthase [Ignavibacteria bacterium]
MFTGLITEKGKIVSATNTQTGKRLAIQTDTLCATMQLGDSIAINGVCQTAVQITNNTFAVDVISETLKKTTLGYLSIGQSVNLEPAATLTTRLGGHFVQGHIDTTAQLLQITRMHQTVEFIFSFPTEYRKYLAHTGSIAIDGVSLTTAQIYDASFKVALIPHTLQQTLFGSYKVGDRVNLEFDIIGKYVETMLLYGTHITQS